MKVHEEIYLDNPWSCIKKKKKDNPWGLVRQQQQQKKDNPWRLYSLFYFMDGLQ